MGFIVFLPKPTEALCLQSDFKVQVLGAVICTFAVCYCLNNDFVIVPFESMSIKMFQMHSVSEYILPSTDFPTQSAEKMHPLQPDSRVSIELDAVLPQIKCRSQFKSKKLKARREINS